MDDNKVYQVYSFRSGRFFKANLRPLCMRVRANGNDSSSVKTKITLVDGTFTHEHFSYYLTFSSGKKKSYVLYVDDNKKFKLKEFKKAMMKEKSDRSALFIPESVSQSAFRVFKLAKPGLENYCIAADEKGRLSLKMVNLETPQPGTLFVVSSDG